LDDALAGAPGMEATADFSPDENGLIPIRMETWAGFVFICYSHETPPLTDCLGDLDRTAR